jgi:putative IMPACT (imprinted ancient) family translation regulator
MSKFVVPMFESEQGWGSKIDGHAGPFDSKEDAASFMKRYNTHYNNEKITPSYYIMALDPVPYDTQKCDYRTDVPYNGERDI